MDVVTRSAWLGLLVLVMGACTTLPERTYYPDPADPDTRVLAEALWRAARRPATTPTCIRSQ